MPEVTERKRQYNKEYAQSPEERERRRNPERKLYMHLYIKRWLARIKSKESHFLAKNKVLMYYSNPAGTPVCNNCGEQDVEVLCIDHIRGGGQKQREQFNGGLGTAFYRWLIRNGYPMGYQVLCWNCNHRKRRYETSLTKREPIKTKGGNYRGGQSN